MLKVYTFVFNDFSENTYLVYDEDSRDTLVIDPGCNSSYEENIISEHITHLSLVIKSIINTHVHLDHIFGNHFFVNKFNVPLLCHKDDEFLYEIQPQQAANYGIRMNKSPLPSGYLKEDDEIRLGESVLKILHTPGHSPGGICLYSENDKICFSGDLLFREGVGRTDLWKGDYFKLVESIEDKVFLLPDDTVVYSGHGEPTTIGYEKENNPFL